MVLGEMVNKDTQEKTLTKIEQNLINIRNKEIRISRQLNNHQNFKVSFEDDFFVKSIL